MGDVGFRHGLLLALRQVAPSSEQRAIEQDHDDDGKRPRR